MHPKTIICAFNISNNTYTQRFSFHAKVSRLNEGQEMALRMSQEELPNRIMSPSSEWPKTEQARLNLGPEVAKPSVFLTKKEFRKQLTCLLSNSSLCLF